MIVMELIDGIKLNQVSEDDSERRHKLARRGLRITVKQILEDGFFHADPHPGNIIVRKDNVLCLLDCGLVGRLTDSMRFKLADLIPAIAHKDSDHLLDIVLDLTHEYDRADREDLHRDLLDLLDGYHSISLAELDLQGFLAEITDILRKQRLTLPQNLAVMIKTLITVEGLTRELDPEMDVIAEIQPLVTKLLAEKWKPANIWRNVRTGIRHVLALQRQLPERMNQIIEKVIRNELAIKFQHENLEPLQRTLEDTASRLTVAVIIGAMVIGSSLIISAQVGPRLFDFPVLGIIGYVISAVLGLWIVINILRSKW
jgi:ubiquinone biosynthesis protein